MITQAALLHRPGPVGGLANLGLWTGHARQGYAEASAGLVQAVGHAARLRVSARVLSLGCGAGAELGLWTRHFGVAEAAGADPDAHAVAAAQRAGLMVWHADARHALERADPGLDAIVSVDALYHASPREALWAPAWQRLRPGGRFCFSDLTLDRKPRAALRAMGRACDIDVTDLRSIDARVQALRAAGFTEIEATALDEAVLDGLHAFVLRQTRLLGPLERLHPAWWRVAATAALIPPARAAGLGYALFTARRPT